MQEEIQFPINEALLEEASKIKQERRLVRERLSKIEAKKSEVSPSVYQRVKQDYTAKLEEVTNALLEKKTDIDRELSALYENRTKVAENMEQHKEKLEELKFRHQLGEYDDAKFQEESKEAAVKIGKFEKILAAVSSNIERYEAIFADEEGIAETPPAHPKKKAATKPPASLEGSDYMISPPEPEEENYFAPEPATSKSLSVSESTKKTAVGSGAARVIVIEGGHSGHEYKLKKENTIGRANSNAIVLKDAKVSRQHAVIKQAGNEFIILDLNSSNGIYVNHERVKEHVLGDGDQIQIGDNTMQFKI